MKKVFEKKKKLKTTLKLIKKDKRWKLKR